MNIGIVTTWFERGAAYVSKSYVDALKTNHNVFVFARGGESYALGDKKWDKEYVTWGKKIPDNWFRISWPEFKAWVDKNKIETVIFNEQQDWEIIVDCRKLNIKTVAYIDYYTKITIPFFNLYDAVICHTKRHYSVFKKNHQQAFYVPWGTDISLFKPSNFINKSNDEVVFFHSAGMGGIGLRKGTDLLVKAFNKIKGGAKLIIHSQVPVEKFGEATEIIKENSKIEFIEKSVSAPGLYHLGDVYVYPSRLEGLGLTIMEAIACGLPVITTNCAPMNEFVKEDVNGKLVEVDQYICREDNYYWAESICNIKSLYEAMIYFITKKENLPKFKESSRNFALKHLDWEKNSKNLCEVLINTTICNNDNLSKYKDNALGYSFNKRRNNSFTKRLLRKIYRKFYLLD